MSIPRTTRRQTRRAAGVLASTVRTGSRTRMRPSLPHASLPGAEGEMRILDTPELELGPLALDSELNRSSGLGGPGPALARQPGATLSVTIRLRDRSNDCTPWVGAQVDVSQLHPEREHAGSASQLDFLAGQQITGDDGSVTFHAVYPAWRKSRSVSMKVRIRTFDDQARTFSWKTRVVFAHPQEREAVDDSDAIALRGSDDEGHTGTIDIALDASATTNQAPAQNEPAPAQLLRAHVESTPGGRRMLVVTSEARQRTSLSIRLAGPSGQLLVRRRATVGFGTHTLQADIPARAHAGAARLALAMSTNAGTEHSHLRISMPQAA
jgi:hypothetical protein